MTVAAPNLLALLDPAVRPDPYPLYAQIREAAPAVLFDGQLGVVASFENCSAILRSSSVGSDRRKSTLFQTRAQTLNAQVPPGVPGIVESPMFLFQDPPDHTRLRRLAAKAFTPRRVELLRDDIARITHELVDDFAGHDSVDLIQGLAYPLPITIISNLLGVPTADTALLRPGRPR